MCTPYLETSLLCVGVPNMIVWAENPLKYSYLRRLERMQVPARSNPLRSMISYFRGIGKVIGVEVTKKAPKTDPPRFRYGECTVYYLKPVDRDLCPDGVYSGPLGVYCLPLPAESVDPKLLFHFEDSCLLVDKVPRADQINFRVQMEALS